MKLTYIYHSCFAIEGENFTILIDFFKDTEGYRNGMVHDYFLKRPNKLYLLSSHSHPDHFNKEILDWKAENKEIIYLFSKDILENGKATEQDAVYLNKLDVYRDETLSVKAYGSTDIGISFLIEVEGKRIFHAGDLNNWHWNEESTPEEIQEAETFYSNELNIISSEVTSLDLAMFPIDPRLGKDYMKGAMQLLEQIKVREFIPMHFDEEYEKANAFRQYAEAKGTKFIELTHKGESIEF